MRPARHYIEASPNSNSCISLSSGDHFCKFQSVLDLTYLNIDLTEQEPSVPQSIPSQQIEISSEEVKTLQEKLEEQATLLQAKENEVNENKKIALRSDHSPSFLCFTTL